MIPEIETSRWNHGTQSNIIATVTCKHEIEFHPEDIIRLLQCCGSDSIAKIINKLGSIFNQYEIDCCYASDDLDEAGKKFIEDMAFYLKEDKADERV